MRDSLTHRVEHRAPLNAARPCQPNRGRPLRQNGFAPDQSVKSAIPLFHLGRAASCALVTGPETAKELSGSSAQEPSYPGRLPSQGKAATR
jgi:hypothetical protein